MKTLKAIFIVTAALALILAGCGKDDDPDGGGSGKPAVESITLSSTTVNVRAGAAGTIVTYTFNPPKSVGKIVISYTTGSTAIATVVDLEDNGLLITGVATGQAVVKIADETTKKFKNLTINVTGGGDGGGDGGTTLPISWKMGDSAIVSKLTAAGWKDDGGSDNPTNNNTDVDLGGGLTLTGSKRNTRLNSGQQASPYTGCIQPNGAGDWGKISGISGNYKVTVYYTSTGSRGNNRKSSIEIGGAKTDGPVTGTTASTIISVTATGSGDAVLSVDGGIRVYEVKAENP